MRSNNQQTTKGAHTTAVQISFPEILPYIVDSQIVHAMIQKDSYGFNTFAATCIGEIQEDTDPGSRASITLLIG